MFSAMIVVVFWAFRSWFRLLVCLIEVNISLYVTPPIQDFIKHPDYVSHYMYLSVWPDTFATCQNLYMCIVDVYAL